MALRSESVFARSHTDDPVLADATYNLLLGLVLCWGFAVNWLILRLVSTEWIAGLNPFVFIIGYFASCLGGVYLYNRSSAPLVSFIGYNLVVVPFGFVVNLIVGQSDPTLVLEAVQITGLVTAIMMLAGTLFPAFFRAIYAGLTLALVAVIVVELFQVFVLRMHSGWIDWVVAAIFCGYIGYDWARANQVPKTADNAVDCAAAIYMDIINLFLRILRMRRR